MSKNRSKQKKLNKLRQLKQRQRSSSPEALTGDCAGTPNPLLKDLSPTWQQFYRTVIEQLITRQL